MLNNLPRSHSQYIYIKGHVTLAVIEGAWHGMKIVYVSQHLDSKFIDNVITSENLKAFSDQ